MNFKMVFNVVGKMLMLLAALLILPTIVSLIYDEQLRITISFFSTVIVCFLLSVIMHYLTKDVTERDFYKREGYVIVTLTWVIFSLLGALPFYLSGEIPHYIDSLFETVSGFTTTGSTILQDIESLSKSLLFWRSFTHFIGGMGVIVFALAILPRSPHTIHIAKAEVPGPTFGKLVSKLSTTARMLYKIYIVMTIVLIILLMFGGLDLFESSLLAFGTAGTGGFGARNGSILPYNSPYIEVVLGIGMIVFGVNFNIYYFILIGKIKDVFKNEELKYYLLIVFGAIVLIVLNICKSYDSILHCIRDVFFSVSSVITTTGYSTTDFDLWPKLSQAILVLLMFIGACAGSTGGGIKVSRIWILFKSIKKEMHLYLHPRNVEKVYMDRHPVEHDTMRSVNIYLAVYIVIFLASLLGICAIENTDLVTAFTSVAATFNNIGPGLSLVGPTANFGWMQPVSKFILMFDMLAGRLEIWPMLLLFYPRLWRNAIGLRNSYRRMEDGR